MADSQKIPPTTFTEPRPRTRSLLDEARPRYGRFPAAFYKAAAIDALAIGCAVLAGYFSSRFILGNGGPALPLIFFGMLLIFSFFGTLFVHDWRRRYAVMLFSVIGSMGFFYSLPLPLLAAASALMLCFFFLGKRKAGFEIENNLAFRFIKCAKPEFSHMVSGIVLAAVLIYAPSAEKSDTVISEPQFAKIYEFTLGGVEDVYHGLRFTSTLEEFAIDIVRQQLGKDERFAALPEDAQASVLQEAAGKIIQNAQKGIGVAITGEMPAWKFFYEYFIVRIQAIRTRLGFSFILLWAAGAFLVFRSIGSVFVWAALIVGYIFYEFLFVARMVRLRGESRTKEVVEFT